MYATHASFQMPSLNLKTLMLFVLIGNVINLNTIFDRYAVHMTRQSNNQFSQLPISQPVQKMF